jgi:hypothetical protein
MPVLGGSALTYLDWAKQFADDKIMVITQLLSQCNEIMDDMLVVEANGTTGHKVAVQSGLPSSTWRLFNQGIGLTKATVDQITFAAGNLETQSEVDKDLADLNGLTAQFRLSQVAPFMQSMAQTMAQTVIYGNQSVNPEQFTGLASVYNTLDVNASKAASNVIDAGGTGSDNTSIYLVTWAPTGIYGFFPKGKKSGLSHTDYDVQRAFDSTGKPYWAYVDHYKWEVGLAVQDWRYAVRIANIDVSDLGTGSAANLIDLLIKAFYRIPSTNGVMSGVTSSDAMGIGGMLGRTAIYCNRDIRTYLDIQASNKTNVLLQMNQFDGKTVTTVRGVPVRTVDKILSTEARVV